MTVWNPETYLKYANVRFRAAMDLIERIPLERCERVYDLGCGTGHLTQALQERWPEARVTGVDSSAEMLAHARGEFPKIEWVQADITSWRADAPADLLFSNATFQWVPDHEHLVASLDGASAKQADSWRCRCRGTSIVPGICCCWRRRGRRGGANDCCR